MSAEGYVMTPVFGTVELHSWIEMLPHGGWRGMSLAIHKDEHGKVTKVVGPEPTGLRVLEAE